LKADGVQVIEPAEGDMACGEFGPGRLPEPQEIVAQLADLLK
jgi:phosphopantothenoylcysteine decarboxylase / phosphopantothenate---cysteine ligase